MRVQRMADREDLAAKVRRGTVDGVFQNPSAGIDPARSRRAEVARPPP